METTRRYYEISPLAYTGETDRFTYHAVEQLTRGVIVSIPLGRRTSQGVVLSEVVKPIFSTRGISAVIENDPLPAYLLDLAIWISSYYACSLSSVWTAMLPSGITKTRRVPKMTDETVISDVKVSLSPDSDEIKLPTSPLTSQQADALNGIRHDSRSVQLLQGVTGSGKTRIYLELAAEAIANGRSVIVLVPEITLTQQVVAQFELAFGERVISTHSKLTESQRHRIWSSARSATARKVARIVVGPRSCLFLPLHQLSLVIIDEAHETSYKQDQHPRYQTIAVGAKLAALTGGRTILGTATPGLTEFAAAQSGRIGYQRLTYRANGLAQPTATILDLRDKDSLKLSKFITQPLYEAISTTLAAGRQSLLYLNRRGSASSQVCGDCGHVSVCPHCNLPLTFHADWMRLVCHHCNFRRSSEAICPVCNGANIKLLGGGTKRIEAETERLWPQARIARLDRDSATLSHVRAVFAGLKRGDIDIVIGTQMVAKGLDLPAIDIVGVVSADTMLHVPDYTAAERTFQLISQVSGRAGRGDRNGQVFIQTYSPDHPAIRAAAMNDYDSFSKNELAERERVGYPPYRYLLKLTVAMLSREQTIIAAERFAVSLKQHSQLTVTGPAPSFIETQSGKYHWLITVRAEKRNMLVQVAQQLPNDDWTADLDPGDLL